jgi:hypothetical protein
MEKLKALGGGDDDDEDDEDEDEDDDEVLYSKHNFISQCIDCF